MSWRSVVDKTDPNKLDKRIDDICDKLIKQGRDPLVEMKRCARRLRECIATMRRTRHPKSKILTNTDPHWLGSLAWYEYMLNHVEQIIGILITRKLDQALVSDVTTISVIG